MQIFENIWSSKSKVVNDILFVNTLYEEIIQIFPV